MKHLLCKNTEFWVLESFGMNLELDVLCNLANGFCSPVPDGDVHVMYMTKCGWKNLIGKTVNGNVLSLIYILYIRQNR